MHECRPQSGAATDAEGFDVAIINPRFTKPLDAGTTEFFGRAADVVVTLEDHVLPGGYGSSVIELLSEKHCHAGGAHRLARPIHRARLQRGLSAQKIRPHRRTSGARGERETRP